MKCVKAANFIATLAAIALSGSVWAAAPASYDPSGDLLTFFKDKCPSFNGPLTNSALVQSNALVGIMESMKDDPTCQSVKPALGEIDRLSRDDIFKSSQDELDRDQLKNQTNDMELAVNAEKARGAKADTDFIASLDSQITTNRSRLALTSNQANETRARNRLKAIGDLQRYSVAAFSQLDANQNCLNKYPNLPAQIGSQILSLSGGFSSGIIGSLMMTSGEFLDRFLKFIRDRKMAAGIKSITQVSQGYGIGCAIEGLASTYCEARDAESLMFQRLNGVEKRQTDKTMDKGMQGVDLLTRDLASYSDWMARTKASIPSDSAAAAKQSSVLQLETSARQSQLTMSAAFREMESRIATTNADPRAELRNMMDTIKSNLTESTMSSVYNDSFAVDRACGFTKFMLSGGKDKQSNCAAADAGDCYACLEKAGIPFPTANQVRTAMDALYAEINTRVSQKVQVEIENNPDRLLLTIDAKGTNGSAPIDFIEGSKEYLDFLMSQEDFAKGRKGRALRDLHGRLTRAMTALDDDAPAPATRPTTRSTTQPNHEAERSTDADSAAATISQVREDLAPKGDLYYLPDTMRLITRLYLDHAVEQGRLSSEVATIMQLSPSDSLGTMMQAYLGLETTRSQINSAKRITYNNLAALGDLFEDEMSQTLDKMTEYSKSMGNTADRNLYCMRAALIPRSRPDGPLGHGDDQFKRHFDKNCKGAQYHSLLNDKLSLNYDELLQVPFDERVCSVYDFFRKSRIYEQLKTNKAKGSH